MPLPVCFSVEFLWVAPRKTNAICAPDICSDKTGTLTQGKMVLRKAWIAGHGTYSVSSTNEPFNPTKGTIRFTELEPKQSSPETEEKETSIEPKEAVKEHQALEQFLNIGALANTATVRQSEGGEEGEEGEWHARGDPTEIAIQVFAARFWRNRLVISAGSNQWKQISEFPFDSDVKKMSVIFEDTHSNEQWLFTKGATERLIDDCPRIKNGTDEIPMTDDIKAEIMKNLESLARLGLRVLSLASRTGFRKVDAKEDLDRTEFEHDLVFHGLVGIYDPPRAESAPSVRMCHEAGVGVHMLTGDHPETARAIAREVGILPRRMDNVAEDVAQAMAMTAKDFDKLTDEEIDKLPLLPLVVARCAPSTKVRMIEALHRRKKFAAMTGDGVNDSPSLKQADVGISMGEAGSDVAKEASDIVLTDDNFASILNAVEEGRRMFDNIQRFVLHVLAQNIAQAFTLLIGLAFKDRTGLSTFPLSPVEIMCKFPTRFLSLSTASNGH